MQASLLDVAAFDRFMLAVPNTDGTPNTLNPVLLHTLTSVDAPPSVALTIVPTE